MNLSPAFVLHQRPYRETSLLLDVFSETTGRLSMVARGVRQQKRRQQNPFQLFQPLWLNWFGRGDLVTVGKVETTQAPYQLPGQSTLCGLYINELLLRLLRVQHTEKAIFDLYQQTLAALASSPQSLEVTLRLFERQLLDFLGYGLDFEHDNHGQPITGECYYRYQPESGFLPVTEVESVSSPKVQGRTLLHLYQASGFDAQSLAESKQLMRTVLNYYLDGKPLKSRMMFAEMQRYAGSSANNEGAL